MGEWLWKFTYWPLVWAATIAPVALLYKPAPEPYATLMRVAGAVLLVYAFVLHGVAGRTLRYLGHSRPGRGFWPDRLVTQGVYACMRHPQHLGLAFVSIALALLTSVPETLLSAGWAVTATLLFLLYVEEPDCFRKFGVSYMEYLLRVPAFNLNPRCLVDGFKLVREVSRRLREETRL